MQLSGGGQAVLVRQIQLELVAWTSLHAHCKRRIRPLHKHLVETANNAHQTLHDVQVLARLIKEKLC